MNNTIDLDITRLDDLGKMSIEGKFQMMNLLKFKKQIDDTDMTGIQKYAEYMKAAMPFFIISGGRIIYDGQAHFSLIGPEREWDKVIIVEYPSMSHFINMITNKGYPEHLRASALENSRLILCEKSTDTND